ncbi:hypothetical protein QR680_001451 [Steinernema hermaphroditum]|uniref:Uncharacterized protein n=1 Tax=Steinernema hermaphroditum TaxID=289476 RepID=A0AA39GYF5_9BILA|nr:hypothetical protein QR680_001451 [Steinernema hermaphroditum]
MHLPSLAYHPRHVIGGVVCDRGDGPSAQICRLAFPSSFLARCKPVPEVTGFEDQQSKQTSTVLTKWHYLYHLFIAIFPAISLSDRRSKIDNRQLHMLFGASLCSGFASNEIEPSHFATKEEAFSISYERRMRARDAHLSI